MTRVTLADVAARAHVSPKTVSNVIHETGRVGASTRERVRRAIADLGYHPNLAARHLRGGDSGLIGLALPDLRQPYFAELAAHIVKEAERHGHLTVITQTDGAAEAERRVCEGVGLPRLDLLIISPLGLRESDLAARHSDTPVLLLGEQATVFGPGPWAHVIIPNAEAARLATAHLLSRGRRRIAAIGWQEDEPNVTARQRLEGYQAAHRDAGIPLDEQLVRPVTFFNRFDGSQAVTDLIRREVPFDGLFCFNDTLAFGAIHTLALHGLTVPGDVAVVGFDDVAESAYSVPQLTTIGPAPATVARAVLEAAMLPPGSFAGRHLITPDLAVRSSS